MAGIVEHVARASLVARGFRSRSIATSAGRIHVLDAAGHGELPPVVLLHGLSSAGVHFHPMLASLRREVSRLIIPDLPGHGFSDPLRDGFDTSSLRRGLFEALDAMIDEPAIVFGNSLGGFAAIRYALERSARVHSLVLASPGGIEMTDAEHVALQRLFRVETHNDALAFVDRLFARRSRLRHLFAWGLRRTFRKHRVNAVLEAVDRNDLLRAEDLRAIEHPIMVIWGGSERILPERHLHFLREHLPSHARIERPARFGHSPFLDDAAALSARLVDFGAATSADRKSPPRPSRPWMQTTIVCDGDGRDEGDR